jgi:hypothetical protein
VVSVDLVEPADVVDRLLWRDAQRMLGRHTTPDGHGNCVWCGRDFPCPPRRLAERAQDAAFKPWNEAWTVRHDLHSLRAVPSWRAEFDRTAARRTPDYRAPLHAARNSGYFD